MTASTCSSRHPDGPEQHQFACIHPSVDALTAGCVPATTSRMTSSSATVSHEGTSGWCSDPGRRDCEFACATRASAASVAMNGWRQCCAVGGEDLDRDQLDAKDRSHDLYRVASSGSAVECMHRHRESGWCARWYSNSSTRRRHSAESPRTRCGRRCDLLVDTTGDGDRGTSGSASSARRRWCLDPGSRYQ